MIFTFKKYLLLGIIYFKRKYFPERVTIMESAIEYHYKNNK